MVLSSGRAQTLNLPPRPASAPNGTQFTNIITSLSRDEREQWIYAQIINGNVPSWLRTLKPISVTAPEARRTGLGRALVAEGLRRVEQLWGSLPVRIGAQRYLERFYGEFGFETASPEYDEDGIPHVEMIRTAR